MPIDTRPVSTSTTATGTAGEACPYCRTSDRTRQTSDTGRIQAWACDRCDTDWAFTVADSRTAALLGDLGAAAEEISRLRWILRQVVMLADDAVGLTDQQLRDRLALAESCVRLSPVASGGLSRLAGPQHGYPGATRLHFEAS